MGKLINKTMKLLRGRNREATIKQPYCVLNQASESIQSVRDRFSLCGTLAEGYIEGWKEIHIRIGFRKAGEYCIAFYNAIVDKNFIGRLHGLWGVEQSPTSCCLYEMEMPVLVYVTEELQPSKHSLVIVVPSKARLLRADDCFCSITHSLQSFLCPSPLSGVSTNGEAGSVCWCSTIGNNELPSQVVESRTEIKDGIANDCTESGGSGFNIVIDYKKLISGLSVNLLPNGVRLGFTEDCNQPIRFIHVATTTPDFEPDTIQRMHMLYYPFAKGDFIPPLTDRLLMILGGGWEKINKSPYLYLFTSNL